ncbi:MAG: Asp-tRNA(Asn)/Glu-tRNA(Gln) amidotransferase subunit GatB [Clostridia bacterium]
MLVKDYEVVIGLEVHAELSTKTKAYCGCSTKFGSDPNTHCCPICLALPGTLPVLNEKVVEYAVKAGLATGCEISRFSKQDRKNYFYPDLPKAYQTSQFDLPLCIGGYIDAKVNGQMKRFGITRIHIEEDTGKLIHDQFSGDTLIDFNRCSVPLIEIVSEPDFRSADDVIAYMETIKSILEYLEVSDCKMQEGSIRCDVNLSVRERGAEKFGTRTETKNLNSFKAIQRSIEYETKRQIEVLESGGIIYQETRRWDDAKGYGYAMRTKEEAHDYRYFPEPDLAPIILSNEYIDGIRESLPEMPHIRRMRYINEYALSEYDANQITASKYLANFFDETLKVCNNPKAATNWLMGETSKMLKEQELEITEVKFSPTSLGNMIVLIDKGIISSAIAKKVFEEMFNTGKDPKVIVEEKGLLQISDESAIKDIVIKIVAANPQSVVDYKAGRDRALGFLVGQIMKETKGKANPQIVNKYVLEELSK